MQDDEKKQKRLIYAGCDLGICSAKVVITENRAILASETVPYKSFPQQAAAAAMEKALSKAGVSGDGAVPCLSTGFGAKAVRFAEQNVPHTTCLIRGLMELNPQVRTAIDVGGHTLLAISIGQDGDLLETAFVEDCAAAIGLFIEVMAKVLECPMEELTAGSLGSQNPIPITNTCVVFAESQVISLINEGHNRFDIFAGVALAIAAKIASTTKRIDILPEVAMTGGMAKNAVVKREVERQIGLQFADLGGFDPQTVAAFGAALLAEEGGPAGTKGEMDRI